MPFVAPALHHMRDASAAADALLGQRPGALGWVIVDKARGQTSMEVTWRVRRAFGLRRAGHAGTLDPLATGILPVALDQTTALIPYVMRLPKAYSFRVTWGASTTTDDCLGDVVAVAPGRPTAHQVQSILQAFVGDIDQIPPAYCAAKIAGIPAYTLARRGQDVRLAPRRVHVFDLVLSDHRGDESDFVVTCGSGTYVRSLGRDLALALGTVGHISALRRIRVGPWREGLSTVDLWQCEALDRLHHVLPAACGLPLDMPKVYVSNWARRQLWNGQVLDMDRGHNQMLWMAPCGGRAQMQALQGGEVACYDAKSRLVAVAKITNRGLAPSRCFMEKS